MFRRVAVLFLAVLLLPPPVAAGAWLREKGSVFLSFGTTIKDGNSQPEQDFYGEYGLGAKLTLGVAVTTTPGRSTEGNLFLRIPLPNGTRKAIIAAEFGLGISKDNSSETAFLRTGLSWGKGLRFRQKNGWINIDSNILWSTGDKDHQGKLDATIGVSLSDRFKLIGQGFVFSNPSETSLTVAPGLVTRIGKRDSWVHISVGRKFGGDENSSLKIGLWQEF